MFNKRLFLTKRRRRSNRFLDLIPLVQSLNPVSGLSMSRRLSSIADKLIRVRRASDNSELDIGFKNKVLDTQALIDFGRASDCFVTTWYDQIGSNHATQTVATNQPKIYDGVARDVTRENGKPAMVFDGSASHLELVNKNLHSNINGLFVTSVLKSNVGNNFDVIIGNYGVNNNRVWRLETNRAVVQSDPTSFNSDEATDNSQFSLDTNQMIVSLNWDPNSSVQIYKNNVIEDTANTSVSTLPSSNVNVLIGASFGQNGSTPTSLLNGKLQEIIIFNRSLDNNTSLKLVSDINDHYGIF